jgi:acyl-CoA synthetase (AMP-forming)/AMP-acid ligase II
MRFREDSGSWSRLTYRELADLTLRAAASLAGNGVKKGDVVPLNLPAGPDFVAQFFGLLTIGATPSVLPLPWAVQAKESYQKQLRAITERIRPRHTVIDRRYHDMFRESVAELGRDITVLQPAYADSSDPVPRAPGELAVVQFTSGSRGHPRGLRITVANMAANLRMIKSWLRMHEHGFGTVSWLPLYHDMGLVGGLLTPVTIQAETALMRPEQFLRDTPGWLAEFGHTPYPNMVMPNFGFERVLARVRPEHLEGLDLSHLTSVINGAERVDPAVLSAFLRLLAPHGFTAGALLPAYGLAEGTLAVTGGVSGQTPHLVRAGRLDRRLGEKVEVSTTALLSEEAVDEPWLWQVSCGPPLEGLRVEIVDEDGAPQPEGVLGDIIVEGPSVADGYLDPSEEDAARLAGGRLRTGDAGFLLDGELYVVGRLGDSVKINGQSVFVEDIEMELVAVTGLARRHLTVIAGVLAGSPTVVAVTERPLDDRAQEVLTVLESFTGSAARARLLQVRRGRIPVTSSGKPQRRALWLSYAAGELTDVREVSDVRGPAS